jgi:hypothetical protein
MKSGTVNGPLLGSVVHGIRQASYSGQNIPIKVANSFKIN